MSLYGKTKNEYYNSAQWKFLAATSRKRTRGYCGLCTKASDLVHHLSYTHWKNEDIRDLIPLCFDHHQLLEDDDRLNEIIFKQNWKIGGDNNNVELLHSYGTRNGLPYVPYYDLFLSKNESERKWDILCLCNVAKTEKERNLLRVQIKEEVLQISDSLVSSNKVIRDATEGYIFWLNFGLRIIKWKELVEDGSLTYLWPPGDGGGFEPMRWGVAP